MQLFASPTRVSLLDVVEGIGHHNPAGEASGETSQDGKEPNGEDIGETGTVGMPERGAEHDWLAAASGIAEETAVSKARKSYDIIFIVCPMFLSYLHSVSKRKTAFVFGQGS